MPSPNKPTPTTRLAWPKEARRTIRRRPERGRLGIFNRQERACERFDWLPCAFPVELGWPKATCLDGAMN